MFIKADKSFNLLAGIKKINHVYREISQMDTYLLIY